MGRRPNPSIPAWTIPYIDPNDDVVSPTRSVFAINPLAPDYPVNPPGSNHAPVTIAGTVLPPRKVVGQSDQDPPEDWLPIPVSPTGVINSTINIRLGTHTLTARSRNPPNANTTWTSTSFTVTDPDAPLGDPADGVTLPA